MRVFSPIKGETRLLFPHETEVLMKALKTLSIPEIEASLSCSKKIAEETGCKTEVLSSLETIEESEDEKQTYFSLMEENLIRIKEALQ